MSENPLVFSDEWEFYPCHIDGRLYSIRFDTAVAELDEATRAAFPHTLILLIPAAEQDEHGLPTPEAWERASQTEDKFDCGPYNMRFVGVVSGGGFVRFIFCCDDFVMSNIGNAIQTLVGAGSDVKCDYELRQNDSFEYYDSVLAPNPFERSWITNRHICANLQAEGEAFATPRQIDFYCAFESETFVETVAGQLARQGFIEQKHTRIGQNLHSLHLVREGIPALDWINSVTADVLDVLEGTNGTFEGWGTSVINN